MSIKDSVSARHIGIPKDPQEPKMKPTRPGSDFSKHNRTNSPVAGHGLTPVHKA